MADNKNFFKKPIIQFSTILIAISALTLSVIFSQSKEKEAQKENKKKNPVKIYSSSKSMVPNAPKEKGIQKEIKQEDQSKNIQKQEEENKKPKVPIVPSSKAPAPGEY
jgi:hypothetical protein